MLRRSEADVWFKWHCPGLQFLLAIQSQFAIWWCAQVCLRCITVVVSMLLILVHVNQLSFFFFSIRACKWIGFQFCMLLGDRVR